MLLEVRLTGLTVCTGLCICVCAQGVREVTLLGQNVNSYRDSSEQQFCGGGGDLPQLSRGFHTVYRPQPGGLRFSHLLDRVSSLDPDMRIRFTSPHPKDFPDEVRGSAYNPRPPPPALPTPDPLSGPPQPSQCVRVFCASAGAAPDCRAPQHLPTDPPAGPEWQQQSAEGHAPRVRNHQCQALQFMYSGPSFIGRDMF